MSLHGSLQTFALPDVLVLLASTKKSGELRVTGPRLDGRVWVEEGQLVASAVGHARDHVDAVFELLRLKDGDFAFEQDQAAPSPQPPVPMAPVLTHAQERLVEWREIEAVVPSLDAVVRLVADAPEAEVIMRAEQWRVVVAAGPGGTVASVTQGLGVGEFDACRAVKELVEAGLMAVSAAPAVPEAALPEVALSEPPAPAPPAAADSAEDAAPVVDRGADGADLAPVFASLAETERETEGAADSGTDDDHAADEDDDPLTSRLGQLAMARADAGLAADLDDAADGEEPINRGLLLKFLSSVRS
ncbi:MAG: resuscitation-promoting factor RpfA [Acidimicrobiaceae bacterium]|nr:resuscitation-promoting factor RpfA [Acidimicrobiaceae bacterium]